MLHFWFLVVGSRNEDADDRARRSFNVFEHDNKHITSRGLSHHPSITLSTIDSSTSVPFDELFRSLTSLDCNNHGRRIKRSQNDVKDKIQAFDAIIRVQDPLCIPSFGWPVIIIPDPKECLGFGLDSSCFHPTRTNGRLVLEIFTARRLCPNGPVVVNS
jgi:hypothetical protein